MINIQNLCSCLPRFWLWITYNGTSFQFLLEINSISLQSVTVLGLVDLGLADRGIFVVWAGLTKIVKRNTADIFFYFWPCVVGWLLVTPIQQCGRPITGQTAQHRSWLVCTPALQTQINIPGYIRHPRTAPLTTRQSGGER